MNLDDIELWASASGNDLSSMMEMALRIAADKNLPLRARNHATTLAGLLKPAQQELDRLDIAASGPAT